MEGLVARWSIIVDGIHYTALVFVRQAVGSLGTLGVYGSRVWC